MTCPELTWGATDRLGKESGILIYLVSGRRDVLFYRFESYNGHGGDGVDIM